MSRYDLYLNLISETCEKIEKTDIKKLSDETVWDATLMRFQVIGENVKKIPIKEKNKHKDVKWRNFEWFRNLISHDYQRVLPEVIRGLIKNDVPILKKEIKKLKANLK